MSMDGDDIILVTPNMTDRNISTEIIVLSDQDKQESNDLIATTTTRTTTTTAAEVASSLPPSDKNNVIFMSKNDIKEILKGINGGNGNAIQILIQKDAKDGEDGNTTHKKDGN